MEDISSQSFSSFPLKFNLARGLYSLHLQTPSSVQYKLLSSLDYSCDIFIKGAPYTGKTLSYVIYSLQKINDSLKNNIQCLILTHTRELASFINSLYQEVAKYTGIKVYAFIGGTSIKEDIKMTSEGINIVIGTPGRVLEMINKKLLIINELKMIIIDDVRQLLDRGFLNSVNSIIEKSNDVQKIFVTTDQNLCAQDIKDKFSKFNQKNDYINIENYNKSNRELIESMKFYKVNVDPENKFNQLLTLFKLIQISQCIIYCNDNDRCFEIIKKLSDKGFICNSHDEDKSKSIENFKKGLTRILVTTVPSKDIDLMQNALVVNYELPRDINTFIKRIERYDNFGQKGNVILFIEQNDTKFLVELSNIIDEQIEDFSLNEK